MSPPRTLAGRRWGRALLELAALAGAVLPLVYLALLAAAGPWGPPRLLPASLRWDRFAAVLGSDSGLGSSLLLSLGLSLTVAALATGLGFLTSNHIARSRTRGLWLLLAYFPFALSPVVLATCLLFLYIQLGLAGTAAGVVLAQIGLAHGFASVLLVGLWNEEKRGLARVARTLGATPWQVWRRVWLPASRPLLRVCFVQTFLLSWAQYGLTLMIGAGKVRTLPLRVYDFLLEADPGYAAMASLLLVAPPCALLWLERRALARTPRP